jgi:hypothetical protein
MVDTMFASDFVVDRLVFFPACGLPVLYIMVLRFQRATLTNNDVVQFFILQQFCADIQVRLKDDDGSPI